MKQTWKSLKSLICPKQQWVNDKDQIICTCCNKPFRILFRRRHHCRCCGRLFCSNCSNHYINGTYIDDKLQKYLRLCQFCIEKVQSSLRQISICIEQQLPHVQDDLSSQSSFTDSQQDGDILMPIFQQMIPSSSRNQKMIDDLIKSKLKSISTLICDKYQLDNNWKIKLADYAFKAADQTIIDSIFSKNTMDILKTVKIETVCCSKIESTRIFKGYVSENNVISKQMRTNFSKPKIIIIMGSLEISSLAEEKLKFEDLIIKQKPMLKKILYKLIKLNPDIIFVEGVVNYTAKQYLQSKGIAVVCRIQKDVLNNIKTIARIRKTIDKIHKVETYKPEQVVGTCRKVYFQKHQNYQMVQKTLMYLEDSDSHVVSIVLAHNNQDNLIRMKKAFEQLLKIAWQLTLQKQIVIIQQSKLIKPNQHFSKTNVSFLDQHIPIQKFLKMKQCNFTRVKYIPLRLSSVPDMQNLSQVQHYRKNLIYDYKNILKKSYQMCNESTDYMKQFYSDDDISLGGFFLLQVANMNSACLTCQKQKHTHINIFHYNDRYVKVWIQKHNQEIQIVDENDQNQPVNIFVSKQLLHIHLKQKFKGQMINSKQKVITFLQCANCYLKFSQQILLSRRYLQNSFQYYLLKLFLSENIKYHQLQQQELACNHNQINRVIRSEDVSLKFQTGKLNLYTISEIDFTIEQTKSHLFQEDLSHVNNLVLAQFPKIAEYVSSIMSQLQNLKTPMIQGSNKRALKFKDAQNKLMQVCSNFLHHVRATKQTYSTNLQILIKDYSILKKELDQIIVCLEFIYKIYLKIEQFHRKDKKEQDEPESQDLNMQGSHSKLNISIIDHAGNGKLDNIKSYLDSKRKLQWASKDQNSSFQYAPIYKDNPLSVVAHALNSKDYQKIKDSTGQVTLKVQTTQKPYQIQNISNSIYYLLDELKIGFKPNKTDYSVKIMFPKQFQQIRQNYSLDFNLYIKSLIDCHDLFPSGGKSNAEFQRSYNHLFIIKQIKDKQFLLFTQFFLNYYEHVKTKSYISKIFGLYQVNNDTCLIVMRNLSFNFNSKSVVCYDLKGSDFKRFSSPKQNNKQFTGKDTNFRLDRNGQPLYLKASVYDSLMVVLQKDCEFLLRQEVIDYSLLVMVDIDKNLVRFGIIDFMRPFHLIERVENIYKKMIKGNNPTVVDPKNYESRFFGALKKYFLRSQGCTY